MMMMMKTHKVASVALVLLALGVGIESARNACGDPKWKCCANGSCGTGLSCFGKDANNAGGCFEPESCGSDGQQCCEIRGGIKVCQNADLECNSISRCVMKIPVPTPGPAPPTPLPVPVPTTGIVATAIAGGTGLAQIANGTASTNGSGDIFSTKIAGGFAAVAASQQATVAGVGPGALQTGVNGEADLQTGTGGQSNFVGTATSGILLGGSAGVGESISTLAGAVNPLAASGETRTSSLGAGVGGVATFNTFTAKTLDP